jgi:hypothetical protein
MARRKRTSSQILEKARHVLAGLKQITPRPEFGPELTESLFETEINGFSHDLEAFNGGLAEVDDQQNRLEDREQRLNDFTQRIQAAVKALYGPDSSQLEVIGGTRRSDRQRPGRKPKPSGN